MVDTPRSQTDLQAAFEDNNTGSITPQDLRDFAVSAWNKVDDPDLDQQVPTQTGNSGKFLKTDGTSASWADPLPTQTSNSGKFLTTDGTSASWAALTGSGSGLTSLNASALASGTVPTVRLGSGTADGTTFLRGDGTWSSNGSNFTALNASNLSTGTVNPARLGSGTADNTTYLRGDGTWSTPAGGGATPSWPTFADFGWQNQGNATMTARSDGWVLKKGGTSGDSLACYTTAITPPTGSNTLSMLMEVQSLNSGASYIHMGLAMIGSNNQILTYSFSQDGQVGWNRFNSFTSYNSAGRWNVNWGASRRFWIRSVLTSVGSSFSVSLNKQDWVTVVPNQNFSDWVSTPTTWGPFASINADGGNNTSDQYMIIYNLEIVSA